MKVAVPGPVLTRAPDSASALPVKVMSPSVRSTAARVSSPVSSV